MVRSLKGLLLFIIQIEIIFFKISSTDHSSGQDSCSLSPVWTTNNDTIEHFKSLYLRNFKEKRVTYYNISNRFEMESRFNFKIHCGTMSYDPHAAIVGGMNAPEKSWPWQVRVYNRLMDNRLITCGGVLISADWVLTVAHCIRGNNSYTIRLGTRYNEANVDEVVRTSRHIIVHENFTSSPPENDIALIKMSSPVNFTDKVRPACLPVYGQYFFQNDFCYITGFGQRRPGVPVDILQQLKVYFVPDKECFYIWKSERKSIDWRFVCVGRVRQRGGICRGDSGSPLNCKIGNRYYVGGVASFIYKNCTHYYLPDVYTKVTAFIDWIFHTMNSYD